VVSGIVLAAGQSLRLGRPKQLLPLGDITLLQHVVQNLLASRLDELILVLGHRAASIRPSFRGYPVRVVINRRYRAGMSTSIVEGVLAAGEGCEAFLIALGDQPCIGPAVVNRIIDAYRESGKGIVLPIYQGQTGHPVLFHRRYREELLRLRGDVGAREIVRAHPEDVLTVAVETPAVLYDIDRWEDYQRLLACQGPETP